MFNKVIFYYLLLLVPNNLGINITPRKVDTNFSHWLIQAAAL